MISMKRLCDRLHDLDEWVTESRGARAIAVGVGAFATVVFVVGATQVRPVTSLILPSVFCTFAIVRAYRLNRGRQGD